MKELLFPLYSQRCNEYNTSLDGYKLYTEWRAPDGRPRVKRGKAGSKKTE